MDRLIKTGTGKLIKTSGGKLIKISGIYKPFTMTVDTTKAGTSANNQFTIPTTGGGYNYTIRTSDGQKIEGVTGSYTITFPDPGIYDVEIDGAFPRIYFNDGGDKLKLMDIKKWGNIKWTSLQQAFNGCANTVISTIDYPDLSVVSDVSYAFRNCYNVSDISMLRHANMSGVANFNNTFSSIVKNGDLTGLVTSAATILQSMFYANTVGNYTGLETWNVSNVTNFVNTFYSNKAVTYDCADWDFSSATNMSNCFAINTSRTSLYCNNLGVSFDIATTALTGPAVDTLAGSVADLSGKTAATITMNPTQKSTCNQSLWTAKNWIIA